MHGGSTHFPIVLLLASVVFDLAAWRSREASLRRGLHMAGLGSAIVGMLGGVGAVISGLVMSHGQVLGTGYEKFHHLFVWPAFGLCVVFVGWRGFRRGRLSPRGFGIYVAGMSLASALMMGAGYWGGEMLLGAETSNGGTPAMNPTADPTQISDGRKLFLLNCAHCHAADATGDEGPDLHRVRKSDARIAAMIKNGVAGEMPKFGAKLSDTDIRSLTSYIRSLN